VAQTYQLMQQFLYAIFVMDCLLLFKWCKIIDMLYMITYSFRKVVGALFAFIALLFPCYVAVGLVIYTWLGGSTPVYSTLFTSIASILDFYLNKDEKAFISSVELASLHDSMIIPTQFISALLILFLISITAISISMFTEGSRMNALFSQQIKHHENCKSKFPILSWLKTGFQNSLSKLWQT
jgi:hypothetical protein